MSQRDAIERVTATFVRVTYHMTPQQVRWALAEALEDDRGATLDNESVVVFRADGAVSITNEYEEPTK